MGEASAIDQEPQDIEHVSFQDLSVENVQEFMPGWEYEPDTKLKSGGPGFIFSKTIDGETWVFSIDKSHPTVRLTSSAGDQHIVEIFEPEPVILNRRNRELSFGGKDSAYRVWSDQHRYKKGISRGSSGGNESVVVLKPNVSLPSRANN